MNRDQVRFLVSGVLFGFLLGYIIAYGVHEPRVKEVASPVPAAGNLGMSSAPVAPAAGGPARGGAPGSDEMMTRVFEEIAALRSSIEKNPRDARALVRLANLYHDAQKFDDAVSFYSRALDVHPDDVNARTDMGICLREMGKSDDAIAQFRTSLAYNPRHWETWLNLGVVALFDKNDVETAREAFAKVEDLNPEYGDLPLLKEAIRKADSRRKSS
jgi:cytochrome c-type biogenesis protein CcmH/NrfG